LLANAVDQLNHLWLMHRIREQARSHSFCVYLENRWPTPCPT
jgi:hypothetical protein